jgi:hypothetical protein
MIIQMTGGRIVFTDQIVVEHSLTREARRGNIKRHARDN